MVTALFIAYSSVGIVLAAVLAIVAAWRYFDARTAAKRESALARRYMYLVTQRMVAEDGAPMSRFPMCERRGAKSIIARTLAAVSSSAYGDNYAVLRRITVANGVESWLLRRIGLSRGYVRARYIAMLAALPVSPSAAAFVSRYGGSRNRHIRFGAMMVRVVSDPSSAVRVLSAYPYVFTAFETAEIMAVLRRGLLPLAYDPLLTSKSRNLKMLGINIVRMFGIADAERRLVDIVSSDASGELGREAVCTLGALHLPVMRREIVERVGRMSAGERRSLCRRLVPEGYSCSALAHLAAAEDRHYVETLVASYKRRLVCCR